MKPKRTKRMGREREETRVSKEGSGRAENYPIEGSPPKSSIGVKTRIWKLIMKQMTECCGSSTSNFQSGTHWDKQRKILLVRVTLPEEEGRAGGDRTLEAANRQIIPVTNAKGVAEKVYFRVRILKSKSEE